MEEKEAGDCRIMDLGDGVSGPFYKLKFVDLILSEGELDDTSIGISDKSSGGRKPKIYNLDMIAESNPEEKDIMTTLVMNLLKM